MATLPAIFQDLRAFEAEPIEARSKLSAVVASHLGDAFAAKSKLVGKRQMVAVQHRATKLTFVVVPGGTFEMGLSESDLEVASAHVDFVGGAKGLIEELRKHASPVHTVNVKPFLCAIEQLTNPTIEIVSGRKVTKAHFEPYQLETVLKRLVKALTDFRLPSEAELEYLARDAGTNTFVNDGANVLAEEGDWPSENGFGIRGLSQGEVAADAWHDDYTGAPSTSDPWDAARGPNVRRGGLALGIDEVCDEMLFGLAAYRIPATASEDPLQVRLVRSLP